MCLWIAGLVLRSEKEAHLTEYCVVMADMGFGLTREGIMAMAYAIVEKTGRNHPFKSGHARRGWYEGFLSRLLNVPLRLSYARALCANKERIDDFFAKLSAIFGRLNLISKPGQIFNADETGITIVHKQSKVIAQVGRRNVPALTSAEKGRTHDSLLCFSKWASHPSLYDLSQKEIGSTKNERRCLSKYILSS